MTMPRYVGRRRRPWVGPTSVSALAMLLIAFILLFIFFLLMFWNSAHTWPIW